MNPTHSDDFDPSLVPPEPWPEPDAASIELKVRGYAHWLESERKRLAREAWIDAKMREEGK